MAGFLQTIRVELDTDPAALGYLGMTDQQAADAMNDNAKGERAREDIPTHEIFEATVKSEWDALSNSDKQLYQSMASMGTIDVSGSNTRASLLDLFGPATATRTNLAALNTEPASRGELIGVGSSVRVTEILEARALP